MEREEILRRVQSQKPDQPDEMELQIEQKGNGIASLTVITLCLVLMIIKILAGQPWWDVYAIYFSMNTAQRGYKYIKLKHRSDLMLSLMSGALTVFLIFCYIYEVF